jgi:Leucine-rich repeat (LRR) protein
VVFCHDGSEQVDTFFRTSSFIGTIIIVIVIVIMKRKMSTTTTTPEEQEEEEQEQEKWFLERTKLSTRHDLTCLTKLNLPNCGLSTLPSEMPKLLPNLSIIFLPKNDFEELPAVVGACPKLQVSTKQ